MAKQMSPAPDISAELSKAARALRHADVLFQAIRHFVSHDPDEIDLLSLCEIGSGIAARCHEAIEDAADALGEVCHD